MNKIPKHYLAEDLAKEREFEDMRETIKRLSCENERYRKALEIISQGYGVGKSADDYGDIARAALVSEERDQMTEEYIEAETEHMKNREST